MQRDLKDDATFSEFVPNLLAKMEDKLSVAGLDDPECWPVASCEALRPNTKFKFGTIGDAVQELFK